MCLLNDPGNFWPRDVPNGLPTLHGAEGREREGVPALAVALSCSAAGGRPLESREVKGPCGRKHLSVTVPRRSGRISRGLHSIKQNCSLVNRKLSVNGSRLITRTGPRFKARLERKLCKVHWAGLPRSLDMDEANVTPQRGLLPVSQGECLKEGGRLSDPLSQLSGVELEASLDAEPSDKTFEYSLLFDKFGLRNFGV